MHTAKQRLMSLVEQAVTHCQGREQLAAILGVTPNAVTEWRKDRSAPTAVHLMRIQDLLKRRSGSIVFS